MTKFKTLKGTQMPQNLTELCLMAMTECTSTVTDDRESDGHFLSCTFKCVYLTFLTSYQN